MKSKDKKKEIVVFSIIRNSKCSRCGEELWKGDFLVISKEEPLCMTCGDLDHLVFLPSGDAALSRRSKKHSKLWAVVVRFSRTRKRYERQGLLVSEEALERAEQECLGDEAQRLVHREQGALRRKREDKALVQKMIDELKVMYPRISSRDALRIASHTAVRGSGRVGRSAAGQALNERALELAATAYVRHNHTNYDELLMRGVERGTARETIFCEVEKVLDLWQLSEPSTNGFQDGTES